MRLVSGGGESRPDVTLYSTAEGGKKLSAQPGWGCPLVFLNRRPSGEQAVEVFRKAGVFYLVAP
jgi:hypothetical protein